MDLSFGASAVRTATLTHAGRAKQRLQDQYEDPFRILPAVGEKHVIAEADGTMICTVEAGPRKSKRPREWKEMKLVGAQAKGSATTVYAATFEGVEEAGRRWGHCVKQPGGASIARFTRWQMGRSGSDCRPRRSSENKEAFCAISITLASIPQLDFGGKRNPDAQGFAAFGKVISGMDVVRKIHESSAAGQTLSPTIRIQRAIRNN